MNHDMEEALRRSYRDLVAEIRATTDTRQALAALYARAAAEASSPSLSEQLAWADTDTRKPARADNQVLFGEGQGELAAVCDRLAALIGALTPRAEPVWKTTRPGLYNLAAAAGLLAELHSGLAGRSVSRQDADQLVRLAVHNLTEARWLLAGQRPPAYRVRLRRSLERLVTTVIDVADDVAGLRPRILRLFDDAEEPTPHVPVSPGPR